MRITPEDRILTWTKKWCKPVLLSPTATDLVFEEFQNAFVPSHMHKQFLKYFGVPKSKIGNRFFAEDVVYISWDKKLGDIMFLDGLCEAVAIYASPQGLEAHTFRGDITRRTLRDVVVDDWHQACAVIRCQEKTLYAFVEPKMRGCVVRLVQPPHLEAK